MTVDCDCLISAAVQQQQPIRRSDDVRPSERRQTTSNNYNVNGHREETFVNLSLLVVMVEQPVRAATKALPCGQLKYGLRYSRTSIRHLANVSTVTSITPVYATCTSTAVRKPCAHEQT